MLLLFTSCGCWRSLGGAYVLFVLYTFVDIKAMVRCGAKVDILFL